MTEKYRIIVNGTNFRMYDTTTGGEVPLVGMIPRSNLPINCLSIPHDAFVRTYGRLWKRPESGRYQRLK